MSSIRESEGRVTLVVVGVLDYEIGRAEAPADPFDPEAVRATRWLSQRTGCPAWLIRRALWRLWVEEAAA